MTTPKSAYLLMKSLPLWARWAMGAIGAVLAGLVLFLVLADWNALRGPISRYASAKTGRAISIDGDLKVYPWSFTPHAVIKGLKIGNPKWAGGGLMADIPTATVGVSLLPLLTGHWDVRLVDLEQPKVWLWVDKQDRANWQGDQPKGAPTKLPPIERFVVDGGQLGFAHMPRALRLGGTVNSHEIARGAGGGSFELMGGGSLNRRPFHLSITGAPLLNVRASKPYDFKADMTAGDTRVAADGVLPHPFDFGNVQAALTVSGRDFADLYDVTGVALPNTPTYHLSGDLNRQGHRFTFTKVHGIVGSSDLAGDFQVDRIDNRPNLHADLHSHSLDIRDLGSLVGAPRPSAASPLQQAQAAKRRVEGRLMPDATMNLGKIRSTDAEVHFTADAVTAQGVLPLSKMKLDLTLDHGVLSLNPVVFSLPRGDVSAKIRIDARGDTPKDDIDARVLNAHLEDFFHNSANPPLEGTLEARVQLHGVGDSVHKAASTANGTVALAVPNGQIRQLFAEGLGIDASKALGLLLSKSQKQIGVRCAMADFSANNGVLSARNVVLDTDSVLAHGKGTVDMGRETLDLSLEGRPKALRLIRVMAPITLTGHIRSPHVGFKAGKAPAQAAAAVGLAAVLTPLAAVLPFIDPGLAKNADCASLLSEAQQKGAPVKPSSAPSLKAPAKPLKR